MSSTPTVREMVTSLGSQYSDGDLIGLIEARERDIAQQVIDKLVDEGFHLDFVLSLLRGTGITLPDVGPGVGAAEMLTEMSHRMKILVSDLESVADKIQGSTPF